MLLEENELKELKDLQNELNLIMLQLGNIEFQKSELKNLKLKTLDSLKNLNEKQQLLGIQLNQKYGEGSVNLESGEFTKNTQ